MKKTGCMSAWVTFLVLFMVTGALAQSLDGQWVVLNIRAKGLVRSLSTDEVAPGAYSAIAYLNLTWNADSGAYDYLVYSWDSDSWKITSGHDLQTYGADENIMYTLDFRSWPTNMEWFALETGMNLKIKRDSVGQLNSATMSSLFCSAWGYLSGERFCGGCTIKGKTIDPGKLPFTP